MAVVLAAFVILYPQAHVRTPLLIRPFFTIARLASVLLLGVWFLIQLADGIGSIAQTSASADAPGGVA